MKTDPSHTVEEGCWQRKASFCLKRLFDIIVTLFFIILLTPFWLIMWFIISRDGGPVLFSHSRVGRYGREFKCYKFRSMVTNSADVLAHLLATDATARAEWEKDFKLKNDPRITKIGHFIRKTSLDEFPQFFNVLKGDMSLVGPRPIVTKELERYGDKAKYYLMMRPGITGLWQVSGRNDVSYQTRVNMDMEYAQQWNFFKDIIILLKTVIVVGLRKGAY